MHRFALSLLAFFAMTITIGCASARPAKSAYTVDANGTVSAGTRSALDGDTGPGKQELLGVYLPFGPFAVKAGVEWDGTPLLFTGSNPAPTTQSVYAQSGCDVQEVYTDYVDETIMVPQTRKVPVQRTRTVRRATVPIPQSAPPCAPTPAPAPQKAPGCEEPPAGPVAVVAPRSPSGSDSDVGG